MPIDMSETKAGRRDFTLEEANALLPEVRRLLGDLRHAVGGLEDLRRRLKGKDDEIEKPPPDTLVDAEHFHVIRTFHSTVGRFQDLGLEIKDVGKGLVDFPARLGEEEIRLCWQEGEDAVRFFHDLESGFSGRRPIEEMLDPAVLAGDTDDGEEEG